MVISVIDSGFNKKCYKCTNSLTVYGEDESEDLHGTACIKIIDNNIVDGTLVSISAYDSNKCIDDISIAAAIKKAIEIKSNIITISMGCYSFSEELVNAIDCCEQENIIVLAAQDHLNRIIYPACLKNVYAVDAFEKKHIIYDQAFYVPQMTTFLQKNNRHIQSFSGSSISCAYMAAKINNLLVEFTPKNAREFIENYYTVDQENADE